MKRILHIFLCFTAIFSSGDKLLAQHIICMGDDGVKTYFIPNANPAFTYEWLLLGGGMIEQALNDTCKIRWDGTPGIYELNVSASINGNCGSPLGVYTIEIIERPELSISGDTLGCAGEKFTLSADGISPIRWSDGSTGDEVDFYPIQRTRVWAVAGDGNCRSDTVYQWLWPVQIPDPLFAVAPTTGEIPHSVLFTSQLQENVLYEWDFGDGSSSIGGMVNHTYQDTGRFIITLIATDTTAGCTDSRQFAEVYTFEAVQVYIPNAFTPNEDADNPVFKPYFSKETIYTLTIYDRWGGAIFSERGSDVSWNGSLNNTAIQDGIYVYRISFFDELTGKTKQFTGQITLIR